MNARLVVTWTALGALLGCGIVDNDQQYPGTFTFAIRERPELASTQLPIEVHVATETQSPCLTYALQGNVGFGMNVVGVELSTIKLPEDVCIPSQGPAEFSYPIGFMSVRVNNPFYLTFAHGGEVDRYLVIVSDSMIDIAPLRSAFTHPNARRVPRGG